MTTQESVKHNHITRDIKPLGQCPACDNYHNRHIPNAVKFFKPEDFTFPELMSAENLSVRSATLANEKLSEIINSCPKVRVHRDPALGFVAHEIISNIQPHAYITEYIAWLAFMREIPKEPCKHEPNEVEITMNYEGGIYSPRLGTFDMKKLGSSKFKSVQSICKHCGVELQAEWSEKK